MTGSSATKADNKTVLKKAWPIKENRSKEKTFSRLILACKIFIVLVSSGILCWQISKGLDRFLMRETTAIMAVKKTGETTFLAFTICPAYESAYKDSVLQSYGTSKWIYNTGNYSMNLPESKNYAEIHEEVTWSLTETMGNITINTASLKRPKVFIPLNDNLELPKDFGRFVAKHHTLYGKCFSLELADQLTALGVTQILFEPKINIFVFLHHPGQFFDYNSMTKLHGQVGKAKFINIVYELRVNTIEDDKDLPCSGLSNRIFDDCMEKRGAESVFKKFGCTVPYVPSRFPICDPNDGEKLEKVLLLYKELAINGQKNLCERPCSSMDVYTGLPEETESTRKTGNKLSLLQVYLRSTTKVNKIVPDYPFMTLVAEVGGYSGLLLGISLVNLTRIIDKLSAKFFNA